MEPGEPAYRTKTMAYRGKRFDIVFEKGPLTTTNQEANIPGDLKSEADVHLSVRILLKDKNGELGIKPFATKTKLADFVRLQWPELNTDSPADSIKQEFLDSVARPFNSLLRQKLSNSRK